MPLVYADTSILFACFHPRDEFFDAANQAVEAATPSFVYWGLLRFELRHNLRQCRGTPDGETAWHAMRASEKTQFRLHWHSELKCDSLLESAEEISANLAATIHAGSADYLHVAAARRVEVISGLDEFWTVDERQAKVAEACQIKVRLFKRPAPPASPRSSG
jgi:predicted nucleic acid-binding protein